MIEQLLHEEAGQHHQFGNNAMRCTSSSNRLRANKNTVEVPGAIP